MHREKGVSLLSSFGSGLCACVCKGGNGGGGGCGVSKRVDTQKKGGGRRRQWPLFFFLIKEALSRLKIKHILGLTHSSILLDRYNLAICLNAFFNMMQQHIYKQWRERKKKKRHGKAKHSLYTQGERKFKNIYTFGNVHEFAPLVRCPVGYPPKDVASL